MAARDYTQHAEKTRRSIDARIAMMMAREHSVHAHTLPPPPPHAHLFMPSAAGIVRSTCGGEAGGALKSVSGGRIPASFHYQLHDYAAFVSSFFREQADQSTI